MPTVSIRKMVAMLSISFDAAEVMPTIAMVGKSSLSRRDTLLGGGISISRSFLVVSSFIRGGWMNATAAM